MKKIFKLSALLITTIFFVTLAFAYNRLNEKYLSPKEAEKKWGILNFDAKLFTTLSEEKKGAMSAHLIKSKKYVNSKILEVRKELGEPDSYYFSDTILSYEITPPEANKEQWQLVFIPDDNLERVKEVRIHKKCCHK